MSSEAMVSLKWPNGHVGAVRKSMAERIVRKKQAKYLKDAQKETVEKERVADEKATARKATAEKDKGYGKG